MARHCKERGHCYDDVEPSISHFCEKGSRMNRLEEVYTIQAVQRSHELKLAILDDVDSVFLTLLFVTT